MKRRQVREVEDLTEEVIVTKIYEELKSRSFVEQLRLECIADVKKKHTYMKLRERITDYLTKKMCSSAWASDESNSDIFRGQVVECGVLALTVERIVDAVVTRKLHEELKPMISEIVNDFCRRKLTPKSKSKKVARRSDGPSCADSFEETANFVTKVCNDTQRDSKKIFEDSFISKSLARVFNSNSPDSDDEMSDLTSDDEIKSFDGEIENKSTPKKKRLAVPKMLEVKEESVPRAKRERKINPRYSPSLYHTSLPTSNLTNGHLQSPEATNGIIKSENLPENLGQKAQRGRPRLVRPMEAVNGIKMEKEDDVGDAANAKVPEADPTMCFARKSAPKPHVFSKAIVESSDTSVRKSGRPRKLNPLIFSDTYSDSASMINNVFARKSSPEAMMEPVKVIKTEVEDPEERRRDVSVAVEQSPKSEAHSSKRYDSSDLYKPRPVIHSSGSRSRRI